jgi:HSP20 family protein
MIARRVQRGDARAVATGPTGHPDRKDGTSVRKGRWRGAGRGSHPAYTRRAATMEETMTLGSLIPWREKSFSAEREESSDPFVALRRDVDRMFDDFFNGSLARFPGFAKLGTFGPSVDVEDKEKELIVTAELPGLDEKDFEVTVAGDVLTIKGEKKTENENQNGGAHYIERRFGSFSRSVRLPFEVGDQNIEAKYEKGVLSIRLPKPADAQRQVRRIEVKGA